MKHRKLSSNMVASHIAIIIPCLVWSINHKHRKYDKIMAIFMAISVISSIIYHYYYESAMVYAETYFEYIGTIILNLYMYYNGVHTTDILFGLIFLLVLNTQLNSCNSLNYEVEHPICHYIAGMYVSYCTYNILNA